MIPAVLAALILALTAPMAAAGSGYSLDNRPVVKFPGSGAKRISPYPMSARAAAVWHSDACWKDCTGQNAWRFEYCVRGTSAEHCRARLDADDRLCLRACRTRGGPLVTFGFLPWY